MNTNKKPATGERSGPIKRQNVVLSGGDYTAMKARIEQLEIDIDAFISGYEALLIELLWFHRSLPPAWSKWYIDHRHRHVLPESVMADLRVNLEASNGGF